MKVCTKCRNPKPFSEFNRGAGFKDGIRSRCKACALEANKDSSRKRRSLHCGKCGQTKAAIEFPRSKNIFSWCKDCCRRNATEWRAKNPDRATATDRARSSDPQRKVWMREYGRCRRLYAKYSLTFEDYGRLFSEQGGVCAICGEPPSERNPRWGFLNVDHCHQTGRVRGLLCTPCNGGLGGFRDNTLRLAAAIRYLT